MPDYDLFIYRDMSGTANDSLSIGDEAAKLGIGDNQQVVAIGPQINQVKDATVVVAHGHGRFEEVQRLLDALADRSTSD